MRVVKLLTIFGMLLFLSQCTTKSSIQYPATPQISYLGVSDTMLYFNDSLSIIHVKFKLIDGDKDIAYKKNDTTIKIDEYRSDTLFRSYKLGMPVVPRDFLIYDYLEANGYFILPGVAFTPRPDDIHIASRKDTLYFKFWVTDEAGNNSNVEQTDYIYIQER